MDSRLDQEEIIRARRRQRMMEAKRRKRRQRIIRSVLLRLVLPITGVIFAILLLRAGIRLLNRPAEEANIGTELSAGVGEAAGLKDREGNAGYRTNDADAIRLPDDVLMDGAEGEALQGKTGENQAEDGEEGILYTAKGTENTKQLGGEISSSYAILIDVDSGTILAQKDAKTIINPASMTKVLTLLVAAEHVDDLDDTFTITRDITDYSFVNDCSNVGFAENERVTVRDLLYGTILPSGADAAAGLAAYVAGSREAFVDMMNEKLKELGLSETAHVTNCVGIYDEDHYCTVYDMAMIMEAAVSNELCKKVLSAHTYTTSATAEHPEGITISNWFLRRIEDKDTGSEVLCGKTGYVVQSGNCAASYAQDAGGKGYICVTADAASGWKCIYDHVALYKEFCGRAALEEDEGAGSGGPAAEDGGGKPAGQ